MDRLLPTHPKYFSNPGEMYLQTSLDQEKGEIVLINV